MMTDYSCQEEADYYEDGAAEAEAQAEIDSMTHKDPLQALDDLVEKMEKEEFILCNDTVCDSKYVIGYVLPKLLAALKTMKGLREGLEKINLDPSSPRSVEQSYRVISRVRTIALQALRDHDKKLSDIFTTE